MQNYCLQGLHSSEPCLYDPKHHMNQSQRLKYRSPKLRIHSEKWGLLSVLVSPQLCLTLKVLKFCTDRKWTFKGIAVPVTAWAAWLEKIRSGLTMSSHLLNLLSFHFKTCSFQKMNPFASLEAVYPVSLEINTSESFFAWKKPLSPPPNSESPNFQLGLESFLESKPVAGVSYLKHLSAHLTRRAPLSAQLHR